VARVAARAAYSVHSSIGDRRCMVIAESRACCARSCSCHATCYASFLGCVLVLVRAAARPLLSPVPCLDPSILYGKNRLNERRSDGGLSRGRPDPDHCGRVTGRSVPWRTLSERHRTGSSQVRLRLPSLPALPGCTILRTRTQHSTPDTSVSRNHKRERHIKKHLRKLMRLLILRQSSWLLPILSS
jgi:hypothetical protein